MTRHLQRYTPPLHMLSVRHMGDTLGAEGFVRKPELQSPLLLRHRQHPVVELRHVSGGARAGEYLVAELVYKVPLKFGRPGANINVVDDFVPLHPMAYCNRRTADDRSRTVGQAATVTGAGTSR